MHFAGGCLTIIQKVSPWPLTHYMSLWDLLSSTLVPLDELSIFSSSSGPMFSSKTGSGSLISNFVFRFSMLLDRLLLLERRRAFVKLKSWSITSSPALPLMKSSALVYCS